VWLSLLKKVNVVIVVFVFKYVQRKQQLDYCGILRFTGTFFLMPTNAEKNVENLQNRYLMLTNVSVDYVLMPAQ